MRMLGVAAASLLVASAASCGTGASSVRSSSEVTVTLPEGEIPIPLSPRSNPTFSVFGNKILVLGGTEASDEEVRPLGDGALFDTSTREWTAISPPPLTAHVYRPKVAWRSGSLLVGGNACEPASPGLQEFIDVCSPRTLELAEYDIETREWARLPDVPIDKAPRSELVLLGRLAATDDNVSAAVTHPYSSVSEFKVLSTVDGTWADADSPPTSDGTVCGEGPQLVLIDTHASVDLPPNEDGRPQPGSGQIADVFLMSEDGSWVQLPKPPPVEQPPQAVSVVCTPDHLALVTAPDAPELEARVLDMATNRWSQFDGIPIALGAGRPLLSDGALLFVSSGVLSVLRPGREPMSQASPFDGAYRTIGTSGMLVGLWDGSDMTLRVEAIPE